VVEGDAPVPGPPPEVHEGPEPGILRPRRDLDSDDFNDNDTIF